MDFQETKEVVVDTAKGAAFSWTVWFGGLLVALPALWPQLEPIVGPLIGDVNAARITQAIGALVILLRLKTTMSLREKWTGGH
jgi:hypothetical protein